jgi:Family of unknown function (DUF5684)
MLGQEVDGSSFGSGAFLVFWIVLVYVLTIIPFIGIFQKTDQPTWAAFVPIYNWIVLLEVVGRPAWWILLFLIPIVGFVIWIIVMIDLAKSFGKGTGFTVGLILLNFIFLLILGFGSARYLGPAAGAPAGSGVPPPPPPAG